MHSIILLWIIFSWFSWFSWLVGSEVQRGADAAKSRPA